MADKKIADLTYEELGLLSKDLGKQIRELKEKQHQVDALYSEKQVAFLADQEIAKHEAAIKALVAKKAK